MSGLPSYATEAFAQGKCAIGRFFGQTYIYIPSDIAHRVGEEQVQNLARDIFTAERLERFDWRFYRFDDHWLLELPSVLVPGVPRTSPDLADRLYERIMEFAK